MLEVELNMRLCDTEEIRHQSAYSVALWNGHCSQQCSAAGDHSELGHVAVIVVIILQAVFASPLVDRDLKYSFVLLVSGMYSDIHKNME